VLFSDMVDMNLRKKKMTQFELPGPGRSLQSIQGSDWAQPRSRLTRSLGPGPSDSEP
jgi:hypothetical protein